MAAILPLGDPRLRRRSEAVEAGEPRLDGWLRDMAGALAGFRATQGWGRALAAPQLGVARRIVVMDLGGGPRFLVNPELEWASPETQEVWDDCMCAPAIAVRVRRAASISVAYQDERGVAQRIERADAAVSELLQHELDHLDGVLFTDRMLPGWGVVAREARDIAVVIPGGERDASA